MTILTVPPVVVPRTFHCLSYALIAAAIAVGRKLGRKGNRFAAAVKQ